MSSLNDGPIAPAPDGPLRSRLFRHMAGRCLAVWLLSHAVVWLSSYELGGDQPFVRHGSYGFQLARCDPSRPADERIALIGNSIYQQHRVPEHLQHLADDEGLGVRFVNFAMAGSSINDQLVQSAWVVARCRPALLVVSLTRETFRDGGQPFRAGPAHLALTPTLLGRLPWSFLRRCFTLRSGLEAATRAALPVLALEPIARKQAEGLLPRWFVFRLRLPVLNVPGEERRLALERARRKPTARPRFRDGAVAAAELASHVTVNGVPLLLIWQQNAVPDETTLAWLTDAVEKSRVARLANLQHLYAKEDFVDAIHPSRDHTLDYAMSHYREIRSAYGDRRRAGFANPS